MKKSVKPLSLAASVLFLLAAIVSLVTVFSTASEAEYAEGRAFAVDSDYFYDNANWEYHYSDYNEYFDMYQDHYAYYFEGYYYESYSDYLNSTDYWYSEYKFLESTTVFSVILTVVFILSALGVFVAKPKEFSILFIIAQIAFFISTTVFIFSNFLPYYGFVLIFILIFAIFSLICTAYYLINKFKPGTALAKIFVIPMLINSVLFIFPTVVLALTHSNGPVSIPLAITCVPAVIALCLCYISVFGKHKKRNENVSEVQPIAFEAPTQPVIYEAPVQPAVFQTSLQPADVPKPPKPFAPSRTPSAADELKKYKELLDMGAITQEEFDAKKKQLLDL